MGCKCVELDNSEGCNWKVPIYLLILCLICGVLPLILVVFLCDDCIPKTRSSLITMFSIFTGLLRYRTVVTTCILPCIYHCYCVEDKQTE